MSILSSDTHSSLVIYSVLKLNQDNMDSLSVFRILLLILQFTACHSLICSRNMKWDKKNDVCVDCDDGTFIPEDKHNQTECYPCTNVRSNNTEYVIGECSLEEYLLIGCCSHADKNCCRSDRLFVRVINGSIKVCKASPVPCTQEPFFVSGDKCSPPLPGTYMVDNHCNSHDNQEVGRYVAVACNFTSNSTSVSDGLPVDTASFNSSNSTGQMSAVLTERNIDYPCLVLQIIITVFLFIILLLIFCVTEKNKLYLSLMNYLADRQDTLAICMKAFILILAVCLLVVTLTVGIKDSVVIILIDVLKYAGGFCFCGLILIAFLFMQLYNFKHISKKSSSGCDTPLNEGDREQAS